MYHEYVNSYPSRSGGRLAGEQNSGRTEQAGAVGVATALKISKIEKRVSIDHTRTCIQT